MRWLVAIPITALLVAAVFHTRTGAAERAAARGVEWLWRLQAADGGWHSKRYGVLAPGHSLTALCLLALAETPGGLAAAPPRGVERAVDFLCRGLDENGSLGTRSPVPDYPHYATALAVMAFERLEVRPDVVARMREHLASRQLVEPLGWNREHAAYGGWGFGGPEPRRAPQAGHVDLSMSRHVMEALSGTEGDAQLASAARHFLDSCRNPDGGFLFSPVVGGVNKAVAEDGTHTSYGTATADGILGMLAMGVPPDDPKLLAAARWLRERHRLDRVPGLPPDDGTSWATGLRFYWMAASSRAFAELGPELAPVGWREQVTAMLCELQRPEGSWSNPNTLVKEDDPLLATALALRALAAARPASQDV